MTLASAPYERVGRTRRLRGLGSAALLLLAAVPTFWWGLSELLGDWSQPEYRFKAAVPLLFVVMLVQRLPILTSGAERPRGRPLGIGLCGLALLAAAFGTHIEVNDAVYLAILLYLAGILVAHFGTDSLGVLWAPFASLVLMLPLPRSIYAPIHALLERATAWLAARLMEAGGILFFYDGRSFDFGHLQAGLRDLTAGLFNVMPLMLALLFYATLRPGSAPRKAGAVLLVVPVVVVFAASRVALAGMVAWTSGAEAVQAFLAWTDGPVFFLAALAVVLVLAHATGLFAGTAGRPVAARAAHTWRGLRNQARHALRVQPLPPRLLAAALLMGVAGTALLGLGPAAAARERASFGLFPPELEGWIGSRSTIAAPVEAVLGADDFVLVDYWHREEAAPVNFWSAWYARQSRTHGAIHPPDVCLALDGWTLESLEAVHLDLRAADGSPIVVNRAVMSRDGVRNLAYWWFDLHGRRMTDHEQARSYVRRQRFRFARTDGALVRFVTPILSGEAEDEADARIRRLMVPVLKQLPRFVPGSATPPRKVLQ